MIIGVVSDTHVGGRIKSLPKELLDGLRGVDLIIHAGDILKDFVIYELEEIAPVRLWREITMIIHAAQTRCQKDNKCR